MTLYGHKVISTEEMARIEKLSIQEGASSDVYMQKAGAYIANFAHTLDNDRKRVRAFLRLVDRILDQAGGFPGRLGTPLGQVAYLVGDDGEPLAVLSRACRFPCRRPMTKSLRPRR